MLFFEIVTLIYFVAGCVVPLSHEGVRGLLRDERDLQEEGRKRRERLQLQDAPLPAGELAVRERGGVRQDAICAGRGHAEVGAGDGRQGGQGAAQAAVHRHRTRVLEPRRPQRLAQIHLTRVL